MITMLKRIARDRGGLAMIEFAVSLPVLLILGLFGLEVAHFAMANMRVSQIAMLTADNAGRVRDAIDEINVNEIMHGAMLMGDSINFGANGRIVLSSVENNAAANGQWIRWQRCKGAKQVSSAYGAQDKGKTDSTLPAMGATGHQITALAGTAIMFVEVTYDYQPLMLPARLGARTLHSESAFNVRQRTDQAIKNAKNLPAGQVSSCTAYTA